MATGTRMGGPGSPRRGERPVLPPPLPPRTLRPGHPLTSQNDQRYVGSIVAVMATLDMNAICQLAPSELPPEIKWAIRALDEQEWLAIRRESIRAQADFIELTQGAYRQLRRGEPWALDQFFKTST